MCIFASSNLTYYYFGNATQSRICQYYREAERREIDPDERDGGRTPFYYHQQSPDHAPPHYGYSERRRFPDRVFRYARHYSAEIRTARKYDGICAQLSGR